MRLFGSARSLLLLLLGLSLLLSSSFVACSGCGWSGTLVGPVPFGFWGGLCFCLFGFLLLGWVRVAVGRRRALGVASTGCGFEGDGLWGLPFCFRSLGGLFAELPFSLGLVVLHSINSSSIEDRPGPGDCSSSFGKYLVDSTIAGEGIIGVNKTYEGTDSVLLSVLDFKFLVPLNCERLDESECLLEREFNCIFVKLVEGAKFQGVAKEADEDSL